ncbi:hypothetical protein TNCV_5080201 [Trichonephila clavipes]|nr:hypothetical protein TNCV_5080201 [Trichonephila clavipes]
MPLKGFKKCAIETHNPLVLSKHDFAASKATDYDVVGDETKNNSANPQTPAVKNQHINPPEEPELIANADYDALKKPVSAFFIYFKPLPKATQLGRPQARLRTSTLGVSLQTDSLIGTSAHAPQRPVVTYTCMGTVDLGSHGLLRH